MKKRVLLHQRCIAWTVVVVIGVVMLPIWLPLAWLVVLYGVLLLVREIYCAFSGRKDD